MIMEFFILIYHIARMLGRGKHWRILQIGGDLPNFILQINDVYYKETKRAKFYPPKASDGKFTKVFLRQMFAPYGIATCMIPL